jgi:hypothetical protein
MIERTTVRLPRELIARAKRAAAAEGRTLTSFIEDGLRLLLSSKGKPAKAKRVLPRISKATGGPMPGFETDPFGAAQELDDLEYIERLNRGFK